MFALRDEQWQWLAGIIDAEGSIEMKYSKARRGNTTTSVRQCCMRIKTCDDQIVPQICKFFNKGMSVRNPKNNKHSKHNLVRFTGGQLRLILPQVIKYLYTKQPHAKICLDALNIKAGRQTHYTDDESNEWDELRLSISKLNMRGKTAPSDKYPRDHIFSWPWLAGFIDGDGSVTLSRFNTKKKSQLKPVVKISLSHSRTIQYIGEHLNINPIMSNKAKGNKRQTTCIRMMATKILEFGDNILPYLTIKKKRFEAAIEISELRRNMPNGTNSGHTVNKIKSLLTDPIWT